MKIAKIPYKSTTDFVALKSNGVECVYLCASKGETKDSFFAENFSKAKNAGLKIGFYHHYEAPSRTQLYTVESSKEGRTFAAAIKGKEYDEPLCLAFGRCVLEAIPVSNGISMFLQSFDKTSGKKPIRHTNNVILCAKANQLKVIDEREAHDCYRRWLLEYKDYNKADIEQIDTLDDGTTIHKGL